MIIETRLLGRDDLLSMIMPRSRSPTSDTRVITTMFEEFATPHMEPLMKMRTYAILSRNWFHSAFPSLTCMWRLQLHDDNCMHEFNDSNRTGWSLNSTCSSVGFAVYRQTPAVLEEILWTIIYILFSPLVWDYFTHDSCRWDCLSWDLSIMFSTNT